MHIYMCASLGGDRSYGNQKAENRTSSVKTEGRAF